MSGKRRGGRRSGSFASQGTTPAAGLPAPGVTQALASLAAQIETFGKEVRDLKALLSEVTGRDRGTQAGDSTFDLNIEDFRRRRRIRLALFLALPFTVCLGTAAYLAFKPDQASPVRAPQATLPPIVQPKAALPSPPTNHAAQPEKVLPLAVSPPPADRGARPVRRNPPVSIPRPSADEPSRQPRKAASAPPLPSRASAELSGGAPILD